MDEPPQISTKLSTYVLYQKLLIHIHFWPHYMASELQLFKNLIFWEIFSEVVILNWP